MIRSILIADDEAPNRDVLSEMFERKGYRVIAVRNGLEAVRCVFDRPATLGIFDWNMPELGGLDVLRAIREASLEIPVLLMSSSTDGSLSDRAITAGAQGFIRKPIDVRDVRSRVASLIGEETSIVVRTTTTSITVTFESGDGQRRRT